MSNTDPERRDDVRRDAVSSVVETDSDGPQPGRLGPAPAPGGKDDSLSSTGIDQQRAESDSQREVERREDGRE